MRQNLVLPGFLVFVSLLSGAQSNYAVLSGTIADPQSHAIAGAKLELVSSATGAVRRPRGDLRAGRERAVAPGRVRGAGPPAGRRDR